MHSNIHECDCHVHGLSEAAYKVRARVSLLALMLFSLNLRVRVCEMLLYDKVHFGVITTLLMKNAVMQPTEFTTIIALLISQLSQQSLNTPYTPLAPHYQYSP